MDGEKNEIQALSWSLLPLLVLFPKNTKAQPQIFEGKADVSALLDFIQASQ
jgi:hypothetical protein